MIELKRPELYCYECGKYISKHAGFQKYDPVQIGYEKTDIDSFLSQIAEKLKEARRLREKVYKWNLDGLVKQAKEKERLADAIEEEVLRALEGEQSAKK